MREDDFPLSVKQLLAQRVGLHCSREECDRPTAGPRLDPSSSINVGEAAHITAASPSGPRFDPTLTPAQRRSEENGIWLCATCAKLIDTDEERYTPDLLRAWKKQAEIRAFLRLTIGTDGASERYPFNRLETQMPELLNELTADLANDPLARELVLLGRRWDYVGDQLRYYREDHPRLDALIRILLNCGLLNDVTRTNVPCYAITEDFAMYLTARRRA